MCGGSSRGIPVWAAKVVLSSCMKGNLRGFAREAARSDHSSSSSSSSSGQARPAADRTKRRAVHRLKIPTAQGGGGGGGGGGGVGGVAVAVVGMQQLSVTLISAAARRPPARQPQQPSSPLIGRRPLVNAGCHRSKSVSRIIPNGLYTLLLRGAGKRCSAAIRWPVLFSEARPVGVSTPEALVRTRRDILVDLHENKGRGDKTVRKNLAMCNAALCKQDQY
ncbi:hypothetical protein KC316_g14 [Hortaea werneckii]|nr:hypothetical protein KC316_g14 [Hortaea werneckii]